MFKLLFSCRGTLDRKAYAIGMGLAFGGLFVWALGLVAIVMGACLLGLMVGLRGFPEASLPYKTFLWTIVAAIAIPYIWSILALAAKRFRSIGLNAVLFTTLWFALPPFDALVLERMLPKHTILGVNGSVLGLVIHFAALAVLFGWPPKKDSGGSAAAPAPLRTAGPYQPISTPRTAFGQRR